MRNTILLLLVAVYGLGAYGCGRPLPPVAVSLVSIEKPENEIDFPESGPQFSGLDFGYATIDPDDPSHVLFHRPIFNERQENRQEKYNVHVPMLVSREYTDDSGNTRVVTEQVQQVEERVREVTFFHLEPDGEQLLSCPISSLVAFDSSGKQLSFAALEAALKEIRQVIIQDVDCKNDSFYKEFLHPKVLFLQSSEWMELFDENSNDASLEAPSIPPTPIETLNQIDPKGFLLPEFPVLLAVVRSN